MTAAAPGSLDSLTMRVATVVMHLSQVALDLNLMRLPADGPSRSRLDNAIEGIDKTIRECQLLAVGNLPSGESGAGRRPGAHHGT
jgi:hypothetical protein